MSFWSFLFLLLTFCAKLFIILFTIYTIRPVWLLKLWNRIRTFRAGFTRRFLKITNELEIAYLERGGTKDEKSLLFVHGFTGDKEIFCDIVRLLPKTFHVIAIDLPGHGESKPDDDKSDYTIASQVETLHHFIKAHGFGDKRLTLVGFSMGGHIVGTYAAKYGETLSSVVLAAPGGVDSTIKTDFVLQSIKDHIEDNKTDNVLLPQTVGELQEMLNLVAYHEINLPKNMMRAFLDLKLAKRVTYIKVLKDLVKDKQRRSSFNNDLEKIKIPLLCVWGEHDMVLHVSGSDVVKEKVENAKVEIIDRCGHAILLDRPRKFLKILLQFLQNH